MIYLLFLPSSSRPGRAYEDTPHDDEEEETISFPTPTTQPKASSKPSKLVDLGAAAGFGGGNSGSTSKPSVNTQSQPQKTSLDEIFGDFSEAPSTNPSTDLMSG